MYRLAIALVILIAACTDTPPKSAERPLPESVVFDGLRADELWNLPVRERVEVARDKYGIPHFYAKNLHDLMLVQGYVVARDRFWEMDVFRRLAEGKLSTLVGAVPILLDFDELFRQINLTDSGTMVYDEIFAQMSAEEKEFVDAYTLGVNIYLDHAATGQYGAKLPPEYNELVLGMLFHPTAADIPRWESRDALAIGRLLQWMLSGSNIERELLIGKMYAAMPATYVSALVRFRPAMTTATIAGWPGVQPGLSASPFEPLQYNAEPVLERLRALRENFPALMWSDWGSNNWVVGPDRTENGHVLLANDPHLIMTNPPLFYQAQFNMKEMGGDKPWNAYGVVFPGIPVFMIGHTERIAWGVTVLGYDVMDIYKETVVNNGTAVQRGAETIPIRYSEQKFCHGYTDECVTRRLPYVPGHGPRVQHENDFLTFRWTGREPTQDFKAFMDIMNAQTVDEAIEDIGEFRVGAQNFVLGDVDGNFAYFGPGNVPIRSPNCAQPPFMPLDGASGQCEWQGYLPLSELPQAKNVAQGYLATANNDLVGTSFDNDLTNDENYFWLSRDAGFRMARLKQLLDEKAKFNEADMERIQADVYSMEGAMIAPYIVQAGLAAPAQSIALTDEAKSALDYLAKWSYLTTTGVDDPFTGKTPSQQDVIDSVATSIYYTWARLVKDKFFGDEYALYELEYPDETDGYEPMGLARAMLHSLQAPGDAGFLWDDVTTPGVTETREAIMMAALQEAVDWLTERFGTSDAAQWNWGKLHILRFFDPYGLVGSNQRSIGPYPSDGALGTLDAATPLFLFGNYVQFGGPVMRMVTELDPAGVKAWNSLPGGQVHDRESPHYDDLVEYFMTNTSYEVPFRKPEVRETLERLTVVLPE